jgi:phage gpG-like protein
VSQSRIIWNGPAIEAELRLAAKRAVVAAAEEFSGDLKEVLNHPGKGPPTVRYDPTRTVRPSLPGDPPGKDQGKLQQSVAYAVTEKAGAVSARVGPNTDYAAKLEFGWKGYDPTLGKYITLAPRPFLEPTYKQRGPKYRKIAEDEIRRAFRDA